MSNKAPRLTAKEAEKLLYAAGFDFIRQKGSHRIYKHADTHALVVIPFHAGDTLHPKICKEVFLACQPHVEVPDVPDRNQQVDPNEAS